MFSGDLPPYADPEIIMRPVTTIEDLESDIQNLRASRDGYRNDLSRIFYLSEQAIARAICKGAGRYCCPQSPCGATCLAPTKNLEQAGRFKEARLVLEVVRAGLDGKGL